MTHQKTISREGTLKGIGIHSGQAASVRFKPADPGSGLQFVVQGRAIPLASEGGSEALRCSAIGDGPARVLTVEHVLAAFQGLGITNGILEVEGPEIPGMDGSALPFVHFLKGLGIQDQGVEQDAYRITEPIFCHEKNGAVCAYPSETFEIGYVLDYDHPYLRNQAVQFRIQPDTFEKEIAPARTFCTAREADELQKKGFGRGASRENTLVIADDGSHESSLRFKDECARHKVLDILGDLSLLGFPVIAKIIGLRSGHSLNRKLVEEIRKQRGLMKTRKEDASR